MPALSQAAIYQCGSVFQGHPCAGAVVRQGAPSTMDDQSGARYAQMQQAQVQEENHSRVVRSQAAACAQARRQLAACPSVQKMLHQDREWGSESGNGVGYAGYAPGDLGAASECQVTASALVAQVCH